MATERHFRLAAERVPWEYRQGIPDELQERLRGATTEDEVVSEMWAFYAEELNRQNREALARSRPHEPLPPNVRPEWLPEEYREDMPAELRSRLLNLTSQAEIERRAQQFREEQKARAANEKLRQQNISQIQLTRPPVRIEIIPSAPGAP